MLALLLPARNCAADIPGYLECAGALADSVIALDDGSTDATAELLEASPLVETLLLNPRRDGYAGWDDRANRQRLIDAADDAGYDWALFLDADERIDADDAAALRDFLARDAVRGCAYGLQLFRTWGEGRVDPSYTYVFRLFGLEPGLRLPDERLHFNPVPVTISTARWVPTTIRARHLQDPERVALRRERYRQADPSGEWNRGAATEPGGPLEPVPWQPRPPGLPVLALAEEAARLTLPAAEAGTAGRRLALLLPARNCAADLPGYLECAGALADSVIALDDGSTDATAELLEAGPLVETLLRNPRRDGYAGWDDRANRQRLIDAAVDAGYDWALFLDADERIDAGDASALRELVDRVANPECAYGFRVFRMVGDTEHYDRASLWAYRLFAPRRGQRLEGGRLHLVPIPGEIPRPRWRRTTIRIKHLAGITAERRAERHRKYAEADPEGVWQLDYSNLLEAEGDRRPWPERPGGFPLLADPEARGPGAEIDLVALAPDTPVLSAIVISRDDAATIERSVRAVVEQECPVPFEVIVVTSGTDGTAAIVRDRFPQVKLVELEEPALPGTARNAGLALATGDYVSFPGSHIELVQGSLAARVRAHERGYAMVTGSIVNGTATRSGWASYFLDHSSTLPSRPAGELAWPPAHCSYVREALLSVGGFPADMRAGEDTVVNHALWRRGLRAYREPEAALVHRSRCTGPWRLARHHFQRGRAFGRILAGDVPGREPVRRRGLVPILIGYPGRRLRDTRTRVREWGGELAPQWRRARALVALGVFAAWAGTCFELARRPRAVR